MNHHNNWQEKLEKKLRARQKKRHPKMKVSGKSVVKLKKLISKKILDQNNLI
jgi:hypothetical protein